MSMPTSDTFQVVAGSQNMLNVVRNIHCGKVSLKPRLVGIFRPGLFHLGPTGDGQDG
jgi:hypothetical protein